MLDMLTTSDELFQVRNGINEDSFIEEFQARWWKIRKY